MDKIKTVKIKNPDGSISEETYTISVDAKDVDMANGKELQETIGTIDIDTDGNIAEQLENLNNNVDDLNIDIKKKAYFFNTVADMKNANLKVGDYVCTLGYYEVNDGGAGDYQIVNGNYIDDGGSYHKLKNNLFAELIINNEVTPQLFGAYGDGIHDDIINLQKTVDYCETNKIKMVSQGEKIYKISITLNIDTLLANLSNATLKSDNNINLITINSTNYYGQLEQIKFDCTNVNSGIYIQNGRKKTFKDLIFENINNYGFYYNAGYEVLLTDSHFKANGSGGTVGIYCNSSDSKFENIVMIDCQKAIVNKGLNYFNFIHAWILTKAIVQNSIFVDLKANRSYYNQCYSDTYGITFNCDGGVFVANQLEVFLNDNIWTADLSSPYVVYFTNSDKKSVFNQLTNSRLNGVRSEQKLLLSNESVSMIQLSNNNKVWVDNYVGIKGELTGLSANVTEIYTNELSWDNGIVTLDFVAKITVSPNDTRSISSAILPNYFQPEVAVNSNCYNSADRWQLGQNSYLYIETNVQATLNYIEGATTRYIKIHETYKSKQYANI